MQILRFSRRWTAILSLLVGRGIAAHGPAVEVDLEAARSGLIPKREVGADTFLAEHPENDGRGVTIAIFDTGVDPAAPGMALTSTGERKVVDLIDATGSGDVDTSVVAKVAADGTLTGRGGRVLRLPADVVNPSGAFRIGLKSASELFEKDVLKRLTDLRAATWAAELSEVRARREAAGQSELEAARAKAAEDRTRAESDLVARTELREALESGFGAAAPGPVYDCVLWHDGDSWRVLVDTDMDGDLADEKPLRPYGEAGEFATFDARTNATFGVQVYEDGAVLSIVTVSGTHGTHVAAIAAACFPGEPERNGIAPGARIVSIKIGDVRTGGSSYGLSERRAVATAARHGVDLANISWGGFSVYQDGQDANSRIYRRLAEQHDILAVISVGNSGPALSTSGSAGGEADRVLGVGAYASKAMARVLYNAVAESPDTPLQFTARGPTKDGAAGVDVTAPGAAWASLSAEAVKGADMYNGTSMAAPSATGVAALVLSAAKQKQMAVPPVRLRQALILGAKPLPEDGTHTSGEGMVHAGGAWSRLQALSDEPAFGAFYDLKVTGGTFAREGRGLYLRERINERRRRVAVTVTPGWADSVPSEQRYAFEADLMLQPAEAWIEAPTYLHLANGSVTFSVFLDLPPTDEATERRGRVISTRIDARLAAKPELGVMFSIPITVVEPAAVEHFVDRRWNTTVDLEQGATERLFLEVPAGMEKLRVTARHRADNPVSRRFFIQALTVAAESSQMRYKQTRAAWLEAGEEMKLDVDVRAGGVTELAFNQFFYSADASQLEVELEWQGVGGADATAVMEPNQDWSPFPINPMADLSVKVDAELTHAVKVYLPESTTLVYDDLRGQTPATPLQPNAVRDRWLRLRYTLQFEKPVTAVLLDQHDYDLSETISGGRLWVVHESGEVLYDGFPDKDEAVTFPKGKTSVIAEFAASSEHARDSVRTLPLRVGVPLKPKLSPPVHPNLRSRFVGGTVGKLDLRAGRDEVLMLEDKVIEAWAKVEPTPDYGMGTLTFKDTQDRVIAKHALRYFGGRVPSKVTDVAPKAKPAKDLKTDGEKLDAALADLQLAFVRDHRHTTDAGTAARRDAALAALRAARPDDAAPLIEQAIGGAIAAGLASDIWGKPKSKEEPTSAAPGAGPTDAVDPVAVPASAANGSTAVAGGAPTVETLRAWLDEAETLADPTAVSQFFGAKPSPAPGDLDARNAVAAREKRFAAQRESLARVHLLRADLNRAAGNLDGAWQSWTEVRRWETKPSELTLQLETLLYRAGGQLGLALQALNKRIEDDPMNAELLRERIALYRELGWEQFAAQQEGLLAWRALRMASLKQL